MCKSHIKHLHIFKTKCRNQRCFSPELYLKAALKTPLMKIPGNAGIDPVIVITKYGSS